MFFIHYVPKIRRYKNIYTLLQLEHYYYRLNIGSLPLISSCPTIHYAFLHYTRTPRKTFLLTQRLASLNINRYNHRITHLHLLFLQARSHKLFLRGFIFKTPTNINMFIYKYFVKYLEWYYKNNVGGGSRSHGSPWIRLYLSRFPSFDLIFIDSKHLFLNPLLLPNSLTIF